MIHIHCPIRGEPDFRAHHVQQAYDIYNRAPADWVGWIRKDEWNQKVANNKERGSFWYATLGSDVVGLGLAGGRQKPEHIWRHHMVVVDEFFRRRGIGSFLYIAQMAQAILEGKRQCQVQILASNSTIRGLVQSLGYRRWGTLPKATKLFKDMELWGRELEKGALVLPLTLETCPRVVVEVVNSPYTKRLFKLNCEGYDRAGHTEIADTLCECRDRLQSFENVHIRERS